MKSFLPVSILVLGLAACSSGSLESETTASLSDPDSKSAAGFTESDRSAMRPETERSREVLWRLKGKTVQNQLRR